MRLAGRGPDAPLVRLDDRSADRQAHPHSLRLRGVERVEDPFMSFWLIPVPASAIETQMRSRVYAVRTRRIRARSSTARIDSRALTSGSGPPVAAGCSRRRRASQIPERGLDRNSVLFEIRLDEGQHTDNHFVHVDGAPFRDLALEHRADAVDDLRGPVTCAHDLGEGGRAPCRPAGVGAESQRSAALALATIPVIGWVSSCAIEADSSPAVAIRLSRQAGEWCASERRRCLRSRSSQLISRPWRRIAAVPARMYDRYAGATLARDCSVAGERLPRDPVAAAEKRTSRQLFERRCDQRRACQGVFSEAAHRRWPPAQAAGATPSRHVPKHRLKWSEVDVDERSSLHDITPATWSPDASRPSPLPSMRPEACSYRIPLRNDRRFHRVCGSPQSEGGQLSLPFYRDATCYRPLSPTNRVAPKRRPAAGRRTNRRRRP